MTLSEHEITRSMQLVVDTFKEVRSELLAAYGNIAHSSKGNNSPVTELDIKVELMIKDRLAKEYPHIGFQGEETEKVLGVSDAMWVVDPIDGTSSFIHGLPHCTNMAGLVVDGQTVAAVIYHFVTDDLYTARIGKGAYRNGQRISIKNRPLAESIVYTGPFGYNNFYGVIKPYKIGLFAPIGASGYEYTRLAQGNIQGVMKFHSPSQVHDNVPGVLIAQEAGAEVLSFEGEHYTYDTLQFTVGTPNYIEVIKRHREEVAGVLKLPR